MRRFTSAINTWQILAQASVDGGRSVHTRAVFICGWHNNRIKLTCKGNLGFMGFVAFLETPACPFSHVYVAFPPLEKPHVKAITVAPRMAYGGLSLCHTTTATLTGVDIPSRLYITDLFHLSALRGSSFQ